MVDLLLVSVMALFGLLMAAVGIGLARSPSWARFDVLMVFVTLLATASGGIAANLLALESTLLLRILDLVGLSHPWFLLRVIHRIRPVPSSLFGVAVGLPALATIGVFALEIPYPDWFLLAVTGLYVAAEGYAAYAFLQGARTLRGVSRQRSRLAAFGMLALVIDVLIAIPPFIFDVPVDPFFQASYVGALIVVGLLAAAFLPPAGLRRAWQAVELMQLQRRLDALPPGAPLTELIDTWRETLSGMGGAGESRVVEAGPRMSIAMEGGRQPFQASDHKAEMAIWAAGSPGYVQPQDVGPQTAWAWKGGAFVVPLGTPERGWLFLHGQRVKPLFPDEDLELAELVTRRAEDAWARLEEEGAIRRAHDQKSDFLRVAAHELGNPLSPIKLQVHLIKRKIPPGTVDRALEILEHNVDRLATLIGTLHDVARLREGKLRLQKEQVDLAAQVRLAVESRRPEAKEKGLRLTLRAAQATVIGDKGRLDQVIDNLVGNAIKYTSEGSVSVTLTREGGQANLVVKDTGLGLDPDQRARLFAPFSRVHEATGIKGTGLGLYVAKGVVEAHGGRLEVKSDGAGKGSTFRVLLPAPNP